MPQPQPTAADAEQARAWNGDEGRHWADHQQQWDAVNSGFNEPLLNAASIGRGDAVLDIGCGNGATTRLAARRAAPGRALGLDLSGPMLERARASAREEGVDNAEFVQADAQLHAFPQGRFDAAISRFGVMFFADPVAAFGNIAGALRGGGRLAFICGGEPARNDWVTAVSALGSALPEAPSTSPAPGMFSLAEPDRIRSVLSAAGYTGITVDRAEATTRWGEDAESVTDFLLGSGPGRHLTSGLDADVLAGVRKTLTDQLAAHQRPDGLRLRSSAWLATATRP
jgi:SAM-dependent methyltransferase